MVLTNLWLFIQVLLQLHSMAVAQVTVHPWPGGETQASPWYLVTVEGRDSFVWYTSAAERQPCAPGNNCPSTPVEKDTSFSLFDMSADGSPARVEVTLLQKTAVESVEIRPSSAGIQATVDSNAKGFNFVMTEPRQVCAVINGNADQPLCIFADPAQEDPPTKGSDDLIYFGPGVHHPGKINVTGSQKVYIAGGAHVFGQIVALPNQFCGGGIQVTGRGVLSGHNLPIDYRAYAMVDLGGCPDFLIEGITTIDSPQYQGNTFAPRGTIRWAKSIAWGFTTDGFGGGEYSLVEHCFFKVNDDSSKLYFTGQVVQNNVYWQMENGCPLMMSWNTEANVGFITARDNDIIAHEKTSQEGNLTGVVCAYHGGAGNFNNYVIDRLRIEGQQWAFVSVTMQRNPWSPPPPTPIGNISSIILRDVQIAAPFPAPPEDAYMIHGRSTRSRADMFVFDNVKIGSSYLNNADIVPGIGKFATNIITCIGCAAEYFSKLADGHMWSNDERCGRAPQPKIVGFQLPPLNDYVGEAPFCNSTARVSKVQSIVDAKATAAYWSGGDPKLKLLRWIHESVLPRARPNQSHSESSDFEFIV